jgi:hypothetical protein
MFFLGFPYLVLGGWPRQPFQGLLSPPDFGIVGLDAQWPPTRWLGAVGTGLGLGIPAFFIVILAWGSANRSSDGTSLNFPTRPWWMVLVDVMYSEVHWAFYRSAMTVIRGDLYTGVFMGLALVYVEWALNPAWRKGWRQPTRAAFQWLRAAMAVLSALVFLLTRNLWVSMVIHALLTFCMLQVGHVPISEPSLELPDSGEWSEGEEDRAEE